MLARILYAAIALTVFGAVSDVRPSRSVRAGASVEARSEGPAAAPSVPADAPRLVPQARRTPGR